MTEIKPIRAVIFGIQGSSLTDEERSFFTDVNPLGFMLCDRNFKNADQVKSLVNELRAVTQREDTPILVNQEGGRAQFLWPPAGSCLPWADTYGNWCAADATTGLEEVANHAVTLSRELAALGISHNCWPCLDVWNAQTHDGLIHRCFSSDPGITSELGNRAIDMMFRYNVIPVVKHLPGLGRAKGDHYTDLPMIFEEFMELKSTDFLPFIRLKKVVWGMMAHAIYKVFDAALPASLSPEVIQYVRNNIKFEGFLITDNIAVTSLQNFGSAADLAKMARTAGIDAVVYTHPQMDEMHTVADAVGDLNAVALDRLEKTKQFLGK